MAFKLVRLAENFKSERIMSRFPILLDSEQLKERLRRRQAELVRQLAALEQELRRFEDSERPAYESWLRLEFGPSFVEIEELSEKIREKRILAARIHDLVDSGLQPREALFVASGGETPMESPSPRKGFAPEEVDARRRAKRDAKREVRREKKRERKDARVAERPASPATVDDRRRLTTLYRGLARKLHPDSAQAIDADKARGLWLEVQAAYESGNVERLLAVSAWLGQEGPAPSLLSVAERQDGVRRLERSRVKLERRLSELELHPAWGFSGLQGSERRKLRSRAARELGEKLAQAREALNALEDFIDSIGPPRPPKKRR